jgi:glutamate synthase (NADPH/NADH) large chain
MEAKQASAELGRLADKIEFGGSCVRSDFPRDVDANDRVLGTELSGAISRARIYEGAPEGSELDHLAELTFNGGSVAGQGFGAFNSYGVTCRVEGGAQDGVGKTMLGGVVSILKGKNSDGVRVNGSVGKSFAYGAQRGRLFVQGSADSRFCIRLSGADVVLAGEPPEPLDDARGCIVDRANAKGFAFEYMTSGRAVVLGDLGPWACAGMTGGRVYVRVNDDWNLDREAIERRLGEGALVTLSELDAEGELDVQDLLGHYVEELRATSQDDEAERITKLASEARHHFLAVIPQKVQADPSISTE